LELQNRIVAKPDNNTGFKDLSGLKGVLGEI